MRLNELLTLKHGIMVGGSRDCFMCNRYDVQRPEYFRLDFVGTRRWERALLSLVDERTERAYALVEFDESREVSGVEVDLPRQYVEIVFDQFAFFREDITDYDFWEYSRSEVRQFHSIVDSAEDAIREQHSLPPRENRR